MIHAADPLPTAIADVTEEIAALLAQLGAPGAFATRLSAPTENLEIEIRGLGELALPITARTVQRLRARAALAVWAARETLYDPSVRSTSEISARSIKVSPKWKTALARYKERCQHIHQVIAAAHLPLGHATLRMGSPHVLQLRKDESLFTREREHRARAKKILREI